MRTHEYTYSMFAWVAGTRYLSTRSYIHQLDHKVLRHWPGQCPPRLETRRSSDSSMDTAPMFLNFVFGDLSPAPGRRPSSRRSEALMLPTRLLWCRISSHLGPQNRPVLTKPGWCCQLPTRDSSRPQIRPASGTRSQNPIICSRACGAAPSQPIRAASQRNGSDRHFEVSFDRGRARLTDLPRRERFG